MGARGTGVSHELRTGAGALGEKVRDPTRFAKTRGAGRGVFFSARAYEGGFIGAISWGAWEGRGVGAQGGEGLE